jgi:hypothetical protein
MRNLEPVDEFTDPPVVAEDGEDADSASLEGMLQWVVNRTHWLKRRLWVQGTVEHDVIIPIAPLLSTVSGFTGFELKLDPSVLVVLRQVGTNSGWLAIGPLVGDMLLVRVTLKVRGRGDHSSLPAIPPQVRLYEMAPEGGTVLAEVQDTESPVVSYEADHNLVLEPEDPIEINPNRSYYLRLNGESGDGSITDGWEILAAKATLRGN